VAERAQETRLQDMIAQLAKSLPQSNSWITNQDTSVDFISALFRAGKCTSIKQGKQRCIYKLEGDNGIEFFWKCSRIENLRAWFRDLFRGPKAKLEFENSRRLRELGIPCMNCIAWASSDGMGPRTSHLISEPISGSILADWLALQPEKIPFATRRRLTLALARLLANLHQHGILHPDLHPGNLFLVEVQFDSIGILDVHDLLLRSHLSVQDRVKNLVPMNRWFQLRTNQSDRLRFWKEYNRASKEVLDEGTIKDLEDATMISNRGLWKSRENKCFETNRYFQKVRTGSYLGIRNRHFPVELADRILDSKDVTTLPGMQILKNSASSTVLKFHSESDGTFLIKRFNVKKRTHLLRNLFRSSAVKRSWKFGHTLQNRMLPTPLPLMMFEGKSFGLSSEGYLVTEFLKHHGDLKQYLVGLAQNPSSFGREKIKLIEILARILRQMHDRGLSHRDLKASNILVLREGDSVQIRLIDLVGVREHVLVPVRRRQRDLARLNSSFLTENLVTNSDRRRFLKVYLRASRESEVKWESWWHNIDIMTTLKVEQNERRGRPLA
jgi:tRNA A-37 threonylcarbamoyl transferase component Bud32